MGPRALYWVREMHAKTLWGHEALYWEGGRMRIPPLRFSLEGPRSAVLGGGGACEHGHWVLRWSSLGGHEALYWVGGAHAG
eukprot:841184-Pyramimonas_sp.AAC.1